MYSSHLAVSRLSSFIDSPLRDISHAIILALFLAMQNIKTYPFFLPTSLLDENSAC